MAKYYLLKSAYADGSEESDQIFQTKEEAWENAKEDTLCMIQTLMNNTSGDIMIHFNEEEQEICISVDNEEYSRTTVCLY